MVVSEINLTFASQNHIIVEHLNYKTMDELQNIQNLIYVIRGQRVMLDLQEEILRCQNVTSSWGGSRYGAFAFTEDLCFYIIHCIFNINYYLCTR